MSWTLLTVAPDRSHHTNEHGLAAYPERFDDVLTFHAPGLAPVSRADQAWHIHADGSAAYTRRFARTFGFYEGLAAVTDAHGWHHVTPHGHDAYAERYAWCGNFQGERCAVRDTDGSYLHIDAQGRPAYPERWRYAGDYRERIAVVQAADGRATHVDRHGRALHGAWFIDLDVFHKGFARARDNHGWHHIDLQGVPAYQRRFAAVEPFYNGQARVERHDGGLEVIDESGRRLVELRAARQTPLQRLSGQMVGFWHTQTIRAAVELSVFDALPGDLASIASACGLPEEAASRLLRALWELALIQPQPRSPVQSAPQPVPQPAIQPVPQSAPRPSGDRWAATATGRLLARDSRSGMREAALHWSTEHYRAWESLADALETGGSAFRAQYGEDWFSWLAARPEKMSRFQAAMLGYAAHDYRDLHALIPFHDNDNDGNDEIIDAGGGSGVLLEGLLEARRGARGTLLDLAVVTDAVTPPPGLAARFRALAADICEPWPCRGDLVVLARVLHDWADDLATRILDNARQALRPDGRVVLVEWVLSDESPSGGMLDLNMAAICGSKERTLREWQELAQAAGLRVVRVQPLATYGALIELRP